MIRRLPALLALLLARTASSQVSVTTVPDPIVLGDREHGLIEVRGIAGHGQVGAAVNVGRVESVEERSSTIRLKYRLPASVFPQVACLLLWRENDPRILVLRVPLHGRTAVPISTRPRSQVTVSVAGRIFGPASSGKLGRVEMRVVVPPGVSRGEVEVVDEKGYSTRKAAEIRRPEYPLLALAVRPVRSSEVEPRFEISVAAAEVQDRAILVEVSGGGGPPTRIPIAQVSVGRFAGVWAPRPRPAPGVLAVRARLEGLTAETRATLNLLPLPVVRPRVVVHTTPPPPPRPSRRILFRLAAATGFLHNLGALFSPRLGLEAAADLPLGPGRIGVVLSLGFAWSSQELPVSDLGPVGLRVLLAPIGIGAVYRLPRGRFTPYLTAALVGEIVRISSQGELAGELVRTDLVPGFQALAGAELALGRGGIFAQLGFHWSRLSAEDLEGLAGGLLFELGYRLQI